VSGKVYLSEYFEYGRLLKANNLSIGKYENDAFYPEIPQISNYVVLLEEYQDHLGTAVGQGGVNMDYEDLTKEELIQKVRELEDEISSLKLKDDELELLLNEYSSIVKKQFEHSTILSKM